jgi:hypothetical protein
MPGLAASTLLRRQPHHGDAADIFRALIAIEAFHLREHRLESRRAPAVRGGTVQGAICSQLALVDSVAIVRQGSRCAEKDRHRCRLADHVLLL